MHLGLTSPQKIVDFLTILDHFLALLGKNNLEKSSEKISMANRVPALKTFLVFHYDYKIVTERLSCEYDLSKIF